MNDDERDAMTIEFDELQPAAGADGHDGSRRRRVVAGVAAAMLVAAAGGAGYGIGRNVDTDSASSAAPETVADTEEATQSADDEALANTDATPRPATTELAVSDGGDTSSADTSASMQASGSTGYPAFGSQPMKVLFERTTDSGFVLRAQLGELWNTYAEPDMVRSDGWTPAPWCFESGQMRIALAGNGVTDLGGVPWFAEPFKGRSVSWMTLGGNDASPQTVVIVQVSADVANVRVAFGDGSTDAAAPQNGIAVLTAPGQPSVPVNEGDYTYWQDPEPNFEVTLEGGAEPVTLRPGGVGTWDDPEFRESCTPPPPALPDAGEQPADPAAAEAEVRAAMSTLYGVVGTGEVGSELIDDPTGVAEARDQVQAGGYADDAASAVATVDELVFTTPAEAWFRYSIDTPGNDFDNRYGIAVLVDGVWKVTRATVCQDLSLAGGDCGGGWQSIYPPGAFPEDGYVVDEFAVPTPTVLIDD